MTNRTENQNPSPWKKRLTAIAGAGFLFFFIKGLVWLAIFAGIYMAASD